MVIALYATTETTTATATAKTTASPRSAGGFNDDDQYNNGIPSQHEGLGGQLPAADREETTSTPAHSPGAAPSAAATMPVLTGLALVVLVAVVVALGVYPGPLLEIIQQTFGP